ncbi:MAG: ABC transporter ATP-binding protein [Pseudomonadota bacterium]
MNRDPAIHVNDVSKKFRLFSRKSDRMKEALHPLGRTYHVPFWALKDVSFQADKGTIMGVLGRNGSGKSTLLEIIASVMQPTRGSVSVNGRVAALLELGAGFNPEFTGRTNVLLNGITLGLSRDEMASLMPGIEAFADIGGFFDQPIKIYSSGMFVRLAFAAAITVDPDILLVDEALAVGDARFQHKCYQVFRSFLERGKTLMLVSHDVGALLRLCDSAIVLDRGELMYQGPIREAVNRYHAILHGGAGGVEPVHSEGIGQYPPIPDSLDQSGGPIPWEGVEDACMKRPGYNPDETRLGDGRAAIIDYAMIAGDKVNPSAIPSGVELSLFFKVLFREDIDNLSVGFAVVTKDGVYVHGTNSAMQNRPLLSGRKGDILIVRYDLNAAFTGGDYFLNIGCNHITSDQDTFVDVRRGIAHLKIEDTPWCSGLAALPSRFSAARRSPRRDK